MRLAHCATTFLTLFVLGAAAPATTSAQGIGGALRKKAEEAKKKLEEEAAKKAAVDSAKKRADSVKTSAAGGAPTSSPAAPQGSAATPGAAPAKSSAKVWENYDFVPGSKILFYTDFSEDRVGNFARGLRYRSGSIEIVDREGTKVLRSTSPSELLIPLGKQQLPQRFTIEVDVITPPTNVGGVLIAVEGGPAMDRSPKSAEIMWNVKDQGIAGGGTDVGRSQKHLPDEDIAGYVGQLTHLRILMDSNYFKMYANERRLYNMPELFFKRDTVVRLGIGGGENAGAVYLTSIRVAESETDVMYDALTAKGRWVTQGILFATGKSDIQPESRPVLKEIASTMKQHADLKILIEGHTDNVGSAASNLTLSDSRAAAVKAALVSDFGVAADRITTKGFGDTKPAAPNTTALGRAQNRRVEIVKQ